MQCHRWIESFYESFIKYHYKSIFGDKQSIEERIWLLSNHSKCYFTEIKFKCRGEEKGMIQPRKKI